MADGTLIFDTKLDTTEFQKALKNLRAQIKNTTDAAVNLDVEVDESKARKAAKKVQDAAESADPTVEIGAEADQSDINAAVNQMERAADRADPEIKIDAEIDTAALHDDVDDAADKVKDGFRRAGDPFNSSGDIEIDARVNTDGVADDMRQLGKRASGVGTIVKGALGANLIQEAGEKLLDFAKDSVMAASDLQEVQNVVDVTFGEAADKINDFAKDGAKAFGLTELQTKKYTGTLGALFKSMGMGQDEVTDMSVAMAGLVGDMASFYNLDYDEAFEKLRSGISGETEPLKQLGINLSEANLEAFALSEGIKTAYQQMTEAEKATLRYNYIMSVTADAQGDFARTSDGFANQLRTFQNNLDTLKTNIGTTLLPVLSNAMTAINGLFDGSALTGGKTQLQTEIDAAAESLKGIETNITNLKNEYANTILKIGIEYTSSQQLLDDYKALEGIENKSEEQIEQMKGLVDELVGKYPDLEEYVGSNGLFKQEADEVGKLIEQYKALAEQAAYMELVQGIYTEYNKAKFEMSTLGEKSLQAEAEVAALEKQYAALEKLQSFFANPDRTNAWQIDLFGAGIVDAAEVQTAADALREYISIFGEFDEPTLSALNEAGIDLSSFVTQLEDTSQLDAEGIINLFSTLDELNSTGNITNALDSITDKYTNAQTAADSAAKALTDGLGTLQTSQSELQTALSTYSAMTGDTTSEIVQTIDAELKEGGVTIATSAGEINAEMASSLSDTTAIRAAMRILLREVDSQITSHVPPDIVVKVRYEDSGYSGSRGETNRQGRGYATGLDYVPYNEYPALLHRGEAVLRADDALQWRAIQKSGGDTHALDTVAGALEDIASQPINVFIDSEKVAEAVREPISYAQNGASRSRALGVGK